MKHIYIILIALFLGLQGFAQQNRRSPSLAAGVQISEPKGQFAQNFSGTPVGFAGTFTGPINRSFFEMGVGFAWNSMGAQDEDVSVVVGQDVNGDDIYDDGTMRIRSNNYRYQAVARFKPFKGPFQVYGDLLGGVERFTTTTDIEISSSGYTEVIDDRTVHYDFGITWGWAAGVRVRVARNLFVEGRFEKLEGGNATYVDQDSIEINYEDNSLNYSTSESRTDKFTYQVGIALEF